MAGILQHLRSATLDKRPNPASMVDGQVAINYASGSPGLFFKDSAGALVKVGPVHVGSTAPNASPASGGTAGNTRGEQWLDTSGGSYVFKIWDGSAWRSETGQFVDAAGDVMTGALGVPLGSAGSPTVYFSGDTDTGIYSPGANQLAITTSGTGRLFIGATGNVGIGTSIPVTKLQVGSGNTGADTAVARFGTADANVYALVLTNWTGTATSYGPKIAFDNSTRATWVIGGEDGGGAFIFKDITSGNNERMRIDSSGRLLVGTSSSISNALEGGVQIVGTSADAYLTITRFGGPNISAPAGIVLGRSRSLTKGTNTAVIDQDFLGVIEFTGADGGSSYRSAAQIGAYVDGTVSGGGAADMPGRLVFSTTADGAASPTERMVIKADGKVGIGTSSWTLNSVGTKMGVNLSGTTGDGIALFSGQNSANQYVVIGSQFSDVNSNNGSQIRFGIDNLGDTFSMLAFATAGGGTPSEKMRITSAGNVGIGTSNPIRRLSVSNGGAEGIEFGPGQTSNVNYEIHYNRSTAAYITKQTEAAQHIFNNATAEVARIDSSGRLLVGVSAVGTNVGTNRVVIRDAGNANGLSLIHAATPTGSQGPAISFGAWDNNQSDASPAYTARIHSRLKSGGVGAVSGDLGFAVVQSGTLAEVMSLNAAGYLKAANDGSPTNPTLNFHGFDQSTAGDATLYANAKNASYTGDVLAVYAQRTNSSLYDLAEFVSTHVPGVSGDTEFRLRGDGQAFADGSWSGGGADYAEYFEWVDSNPNAEDRRGISVVLDGNKIREALPDEDPIGVISGNPSVVGDAAWNKWTGKYLRDDYGTYIQEDYEVEDEDGNTFVQQRRKLNPAYNPDEEYISREQRPEWDCVGLMGKLRIRKGQVTGSRWIKMRDISTTVEEWLVR